VVLPERLKTHSFYELTDKELDLLFEFAGLEREKPEAPAAEKPLSKRYFSKKIKDKN
jgi:23S rRNA pseudouridine2605 synthase